MSSYLNRLLEAKNAGVFHDAEVVSVEIEHGPGCRHHDNRRNPCTCHPRITAVAGDDVLVIGSGGAVLHRSKRQ